MAEEVIPQRTKFDDYLPVALGVRRAAQIISPAELPDSSILGATIDDRFRQKMAGRRLPGESMQDFLKGKMGKYWRRNQMQEVRYRMEAVRGLYADVVEASHSYQVFIKWMDKLGLLHKELESRPTIREIYMFKDPAVATELTELQDIRKDIRWEKMRSHGSGPAYTRAFPEEASSAYVKKLGSILGFPVCCVERYSFDRDSGVLTPENRASNQIEHLEKPDECDRFAYFTKDFFPCQPDCAAAVETGKAIYERLAALDPEVADKFKAHLDENVDLVKRYPEIIQKKIDALEKLGGTPREDDAVEQ